MFIYKFLSKIYHSKKLVKVLNPTIESSFNNKLRKHQIYEFHQVETIIPQLPYWLGASPVFYLPVEMLVMPGGHNFGSKNHPFVNALTHGIESLNDFYKSFSPLNLAQMYGLHQNGLLGEDLEPWELPWFFRPRKKPRGEAGLSAEHGISYFGPVSDEKIKLEYKRLTKVKHSIEKNGYQAIKGHIEGFFMKNLKGEYCFFVLGGKHRVAALTALNWTHIPVRFREGAPRLIDAKDAGSWPLVQANQISLKLALSVFDAYFEPLPPSSRMRFSATH